ncbi:MAG TPA: PKD domain-containing protein [Methanoculleus sp.]|nr:PKD domain-containing protein [Methanoculleus sp.]
MIPPLLRRLALALLLSLALVAGAAADPFEVATYADLCKVGTGTDGWTLDADYIQTADIQCPAGSNFPRIGQNPGTPFTGTYDGNGYEIRDLQMNYADFHTGMFIYIGSAGTVQNVTLTDVDVTCTTSRSGALAGLARGTIRNCHASGSVAGTDNTGGLVGEFGVYMGTDTGLLEGSSSSCTVTRISQYATNQGGLVGSMLSGSIIECYATGDVVDSAVAGGLIGYAEGGTITVSRCHAAGTVTSSSWSGTGGLIGKMSGSVSVTDCYAAGGVSAPSRVGGLIGNRVGGTISSCYATGQVAATDEYGTAGGLIGSGGGTSSSFWDTETSGQATSDGGVGKTTAEMQALATFADWNIATPATYTGEVWYIVEGEDYPRLAWEGLPVLPPVADFSATPTTGTAPLTVQFTDASTNAPTAWSWNFGDGGTSDQQHPSHTYNEPGTYTVSLTATNAGGSDTKTKTGHITVTAPILPPVAGFWASPTTGTAPLTVQFTDASTNAPTGYFWTFGDGRTSIAQSPSHTYSTAGTYTVALTVTNAGGSDTETKNGYITVSAAPPTAPTAAAGSPAFPYSQQRKETLSFLLMCWGALAFVGVFCVVIFLLMNGAQRGSGGI